MILKIYEHSQKVREVLKGGQGRKQLVHGSQLDTYSYFYVYEVYSFMNGNRMTISVVLMDKGDYTELHACSSGGGKGLVFRFDWGSGKGFEDEIRRTLSSNGLQFEEVNS